MVARKRLTFTINTAILQWVAFSCSVSGSSYVLETDMNVGIAFGLLILGIFAAKMKMLRSNWLGLLCIVVVAVLFWLAAKEPAPSFVSFICHVTLPLLVALLALICAEMFRNWVADHPSLFAALREWMLPS